MLLEFLFFTIDFSCLMLSITAMLQSKGILQALAIDPALGRLDYESLSDQTLMEILVDEMNEDSKDTLKDKNGNFKDVCEWFTPFHSTEARIQCESERVVGVKIAWSFPSGKPFPFQFLPPLVTKLLSRSCGLNGTLDTMDLPRSLSEIDVRNNNLYGSFHCENLPEKSST